MLPVSGNFGKQIVYSTDIWTIYISTDEGVRIVCLAYDRSKVGETELFSGMPKENLKEDQNT